MDCSGWSAWFADEENSDDIAECSEDCGGESDSGGAQASAAAAAIIARRRISPKTDFAATLENMFCLWRIRLVLA
eukprot:1082534-Pyramimonas_sp.AAC.1